jgi:hypothetical protein
MSTGITVGGATGSAGETIVAASSKLAATAERHLNQEGDAAGLLSLPAGLAIPPPLLGLASPVAPPASDGAASDDADEGVPCSLLQAVAAKNIEMRARIRTLRIPPP